jgi:hypothetical protein
MANTGPFGLTKSRKGREKGASEACLFDFAVRDCTTEVVFLIQNDNFPAAWDRSSWPVTPGPGRSNAPDAVSGDRSLDIFGTVLGALTKCQEQTASAPEKQRESQD